MVDSSPYCRIPRPDSYAADMDPDPTIGVGRRDQDWGLYLTM